MPNLMCSGHLAFWWSDAFSDYCCFTSMISSLTNLTIWLAIVVFTFFYYFLKQLYQMMQLICQQQIRNRQDIRALWLCLLCTWKPTSTVRERLPLVRFRHVLDWVVWHNVVELLPRRSLVCCHQSPPGCWSPDHSLYSADNFTAVRSQ